MTMACDEVLALRYGLTKEAKDAENAAFEAFLVSRCGLTKESSETDAIAAFRAVLIEDYGFTKESSDTFIKEALTIPGLGTGIGGGLRAAWQGIRTLGGTATGGAKGLWGGLRAQQGLIQAGMARNGRFQGAAEGLRSGIRNAWQRGAGMAELQGQRAAHQLRGMDIARAHGANVGEAPRNLLAAAGNRYSAPGVPQSRFMGPPRPTPGGPATQPPVVGSPRQTPAFMGPPQPTQGSSVTPARPQPAPAPPQPAPAAPAHATPATGAPSAPAPTPNASGPAQPQNAAGGQQRQPSRWGRALGWGMGGLMAGGILSNVSQGAGQTVEASYKGASLTRRALVAGLQRNEKTAWDPNDMVDLASYGLLAAGPIAELVAPEFAEEHKAPLVASDLAGLALLARHHIPGLAPEHPVAPVLVPPNH